MDISILVRYKKRGVGNLFMPTLLFTLLRFQYNKFGIGKKPKGGGGGGVQPKKTQPLPYPRKGQTGIGFFWFFLNIAISAERCAYFYFPFKSFELPQYIFMQSMTPLNIGHHGNTLNRVSGLVTPVIQPVQMGYYI